METLREYRPQYKSTVQFSGLLTNKLLTSLPGSEFAPLLPHLEPVNLAAGRELYPIGSKIESIYFPETAVISHVSYLEDGSATEVAIIGNEGLVGLSALLESQPLAYWTEVTIGGNALRANIASINDEFRRGTALQTQILKYACSYLNQISQRVVCNSRHRLEERLCTWLLLMHDRTHGNPLVLTHEQIAERLGARRAGVTGFCNLLRENGAIAYQRGVISFVSRELLESWACECYRAISANGHREFNRR